MADRDAWTIALNAVRNRIPERTDGPPWMTAAQNAALHAVTDAGYPPLTWTERRILMVVAIGEARGSTRDEIRERVAQIRARRRESQ